MINRVMVFVSAYHMRRRCGYGIRDSVVFARDVTNLYGVFGR